MAAASHTTRQHKPVDKPMDKHLAAALAKPRSIAEFHRAITAVIGCWR